jgi:hypothetical protein
MSRSHPARISLILSVLTAACATPASPPASAPADAFGAPIEESTPEVRLSDLVRDPESYAGRRIRTSGTVHRVCQRAGCWMELRAEGADPVFVPMAGHSFFLPRDAAGRGAEVEGTVSLRELEGGERAHLESEGATATGSRLELVALGVRLERSHTPGP